VSFFFSFSFLLSFFFFFLQSGLTLLPLFLVLLAWLRIGMVLGKKPGAWRIDMVGVGGDERGRRKGIESN
jgi:hypothetical protein